MGQRLCFLIITFSMFLEPLLGPPGGTVKSKRYREEGPTAHDQGMQGWRRPTKSRSRRSEPQAIGLAETTTSTCLRIERGDQPSNAEQGMALPPLCIPPVVCVYVGIDVTLHGRCAAALPPLTPTECVPKSRSNRFSLLPTRARAHPCLYRICARRSSVVVWCCPCVTIACPEESLFGPFLAQ